MRTWTDPPGRLGLLEPSRDHMGPHEGHERYRTSTNDNNVFSLLRG